MDRKTIFLLLLVLGTAFWGISFPITKLAITSSSSSTFLCYRFIAATLILSIVFAKYFRQTDWKTIKAGIGLSLPLTFGIYLVTVGMQYTTASQCAFVAGMSVVMVPVLKVILYRSAIPIKTWLAALVALTGLFIISIKGAMTIYIGDLYTLIGAAGFALYLIRVEQQAHLKSIIPTIVPMFAGCAIITAIVALFDSGADWYPQSSSFWTGIVYCSLFSTAFTYTVSNMAQRYISSERVAVIYLFEPVFAAISAYFILDEPLTFRLLLGGSLIFAATLIAEINFSKRSLIK
ncbi:EamA-like transporter family protein [Chitinophaga dinghuensis]|uniref:EamA-like transporter family protein n=1 Tax=Chitinophaga dinghuensis TaxID=1539050 RepID=A0A327VTB1_9BACT|nr:DMT family transporter [Chitinophaga dinghuensis]RAJ77279.1 EamA-like transporter family protein [Chitinophaga dinghuensis]